MDKIVNFVIDPPWPKQKGGIRSVRPNQDRNLDYQTLSVKEIFALLDNEVFPLAEENHNVFLWTIDKFLHVSEKEMENRGYRLHARIIWDKMNGVAPAFTIRYCHEYLDWFYKPKFLPIAKDQRGKFTTIIREKAREHSRKPDFCYSMIELMYPDSIYMDVFSREKRNNWLQLGNEINYYEAKK